MVAVVLLVVVVVLLVVVVFEAFYILRVTFLRK